MKRQYQLKNKSPFFQDEELFPLLDLAWRVAWTDKTPTPGRVYKVTVKKTKHRYRGLAGSGSCILRFGNPTQVVNWPLSAVYPKFRDMPEYQLNSWREIIVHLAAHEFGHLTGYSGRKQGEYMCEIVAWDAVDAYRKDQTRIDLVIQSALIAKQQQADLRSFQEALQAKRKKSPEYKLERLAVQEKVWLRKLRLALTKMKKIKRSRAMILAHQRKATDKTNVVVPMAMAAKPSA